LLNLLGYGSLIANSNTGKAAITKKYLGVDTLGDADNPLVYQTSQIVNALPFLAYQKIYFDFYSNSQWEKHLAYAYNVDYWSGTGQISLVTEMVKLRYANYPKDYFMGMLPSSQYGSCKLLDLLGYGSLIANSNTGKAAITKKYLGVDTLGDADNPLVYQTSQIVNALPFLAYQKIYFDFYSNSQWEKHLAYAYNVDYWSGTGQIPLVSTEVLTALAISALNWASVRAP
jgi:hypothetical protein